MTTVKQVLDRLAAGTITLAEATADFRARSWRRLPAPTDAEAWGEADADAPDPDSWAAVDADSRLTSEQYAALAKARSQAR